MSPPTVTVSTGSAGGAVKPHAAAPNGIAIPSCPGVLTDLRTEIARETPDIVKVTRLVSADVALSLAVLRAVNSPVYGFARKIESIAQAVSILGLQRLSTLVTTVLVRQAVAFKGIDLEPFWNMSTRRAFAMTRLAKIHKGIDPDTAQCAGLLCDIGVPLLMQRFPDYADTIKLANDINIGIPLLLQRFPKYANVIQDNESARAKFFTEIEFESHGLEHAKIGAMMARSWGLSETLCQTIRRHHDLTLFHDAAAPEAVRRLVAIGFVAEFAVQRLSGAAATHEWNSSSELVYSVLMWSEQEMNDWAEDFGAEIASALD